MTTSNNLNLSLNICKLAVSAGSVMSYPRFLIAAVSGELQTLALEGASKLYPRGQIKINEGSFYLKGTEFKVSIESIEPISDNTYLELRPILFKVESSPAELILEEHVNANQEESEEGYWLVEVCRQAFGFKTIGVKAPCVDSAIAAAIKIAHNEEFSTKSAEYEALTATEV